MFCNVDPSQVICVPNVNSLYQVPLTFEDEGVVQFLTNRLRLPVVALNKFKQNMSIWRELTYRVEHITEELCIGLVGKYTKFGDSYMSVVKALEHATVACGYKLKLQYIEACNLEPATQTKDPVKYHEAWQTLCRSVGIIVPGGFGERGVEGKIIAANWARKNKKPFLGVCLGMQCAVIEFARNVVGWADAHSAELNPKTAHPVVIEMPEHNPGDLGGTMRLGLRETVFGKNVSSVIQKLHGNVDSVEERHRHRYEVNPEMVDEFESHGMHFVGRDTTGKRMEIMEVSGMLNVILFSLTYFCCV